MNLSAIFEFQKPYYSPFDNSKDKVENPLQQIYTREGNGGAVLSAAFVKKLGYKPMQKDQTLLYEHKDGRLRFRKEFFHAGSYKYSPTIGFNESPNVMNGYSLFPVTHLINFREEIYGARKKTFDWNDEELCHVNFKEKVKGFTKDPVMLEKVT
jgi:hypothetical protein